MLVGYARVSTAEQNPAHQADALIRAGVEPDDIHTDVASGAKASAARSWHSCSPPPCSPSPGNTC